MAENVGHEHDDTSFEVGPSRKYFRENNWQRAQEIVSSKPMTKFPVKAKKSRDFSPEEKSAIIARVREIGVTKAALEAGTTKWIVLNWLERMKSDAKETPRNFSRTFNENSVKIPEITAPVKTAEKPEIKQEIKKEVEKVEKSLPSTEKKSTKDFTPEEREKIFQSVQDIGLTKTSRNFGLPLWIVKYIAAVEKKKANIAPKQKENKIITAEIQKVPEISESVVVEPKEKITLDKNLIGEKGEEVISLMLENALLKEKLSNLAEQMQKLRVTVGTLTK